MPALQATQPKDPQQSEKGLKIIKFFSNDSHQCLTRTLVVDYTPIRMVPKTVLNRKIRDHRHNAKAPEGLVEVY